MRLPQRTLRTQLTLLYAAVFCTSAAALAALAVIFKPNFLVGSECTAAPPVPHRPPPCGRSADSSAIGTVAHDASQNVAGVAMVAVLVVLAVAVGRLIAGRVLRPLRTITRTAQDISARNLHQRLALDGPGDEFRQLGETLDGLFGRLEAAFQAQRNFVANASHELRTPLTAGRTVLQVALAEPDATAQSLRSACEKALKWGDQQERLIASLLTLAGGERGIERWEPFDLAAIARKVIADHRHEADRRDVHIDATLTAAPAAGDPALAESLMANLVGNAVRHNVDGGRVEIATTASGGQAVVTVGNTGPLVPPDEVDRLFQPFQRLGAQRIRHDGGHGLGLAIVRAIARAHGAALTPRARPEGGLDITVSFPRSRDT
ncbi:ATP-binding protein [Actinomadura sp. NTSP31]|uniref:HAMP domain-containing sensor histidine kinase n=1 Tax=Actinomadura sp. NTSP31 TaxID=1735447 RepID=UPI0035C2428D